MAFLAWAMFYCEALSMEAVLSLMFRFPMGVCQLQFLSNLERPIFSSCQLLGVAYQGERIAVAV